MKPASSQLLELYSAKHLSPASGSMIKTYQNNMRVGPTTSKGIPNRLGMRYERDTVGIPKISGCSLDILWSSLVMNRLQMSNPQIPIYIESIKGWKTVTFHENPTNHTIQLLLGEGYFMQAPSRSRLGVLLWPSLAARDSSTESQTGVQNHPRTSGRKDTSKIIFLKDYRCNQVSLDSVDKFDGIIQTYSSVTCSRLPWTMCQ